MPLIRYTYGPDVREFGDQPIFVEELQAHVLCDDKRRAVRVGPDELEQLKKDDLAKLAQEAGVEVPKRGPKGQFVKAIAEAQEPE